MLVVELDCASEEEPSTFAWLPLLMTHLLLVSEIWKWAVFLIFNTAVFMIVTESDTLPIPATEIAASLCIYTITQFFSHAIWTEANVQFKNNAAYQSLVTQQNSHSSLFIVAEDRVVRFYSFYQP
jgi:hypothetical protein